MPQTVTPDSFEAAATALAAAAAEGRSVRCRGGASKLQWGNVVAMPALELSTAALNEIVEHNVGDFTAVLQAGVPLAAAQKRFAAAEQMLALDPSLGLDGPTATIGGVIATADSGPLRHRYGAPRDLVLGLTVALSDGTVARSGGKVIKNVAGYDLGKLFSGSFGTLGLILAATVRLHPRPVATMSVAGATGDPAALAEGARLLAAAPLELESLDVAWSAGHGRLLARCAGAAAGRRIRRVAELMAGAGLDGVEIVEDDETLWAGQSDAQRSRDGAIVRVGALPSALPEIVGAVRACGGTLVGRAALGTSYVSIDPGSITRLRSELPAGAASVILDAPAEARAALSPWGPAEGPALRLMEQVKARFDPAGACNPGLFVSGI